MLLAAGQEILSGDEMIVHIILNSHLDPIWLWRRDQGIDAVLGTAYTGCSILERYPDTHICRGEAWFYEMVEQMDLTSTK